MEKEMRDITGFIIALCFICATFAAVLWDAWALTMNHQLRTVSRFLIEWEKTYPILPFLMGVLIGHLLFNGK